MKVYIIGAGPGDPDLITVKGQRLVKTCPVVLYTGSLVPKEVVAMASKDAKVLDSAGMTLDDIMDVLIEAKKNDQDVARVHTGDPSIFGSTAEQMRRMDKVDISYEVIPGVSSFVASAAALSKELTLPEISQTVIISRAAGRTPVPDNEKLEELAKTGCTLALFLSITLIRKVTRQLIPFYGEDCPVAVVHKASCPEQVTLTGTLKDITKKVTEAKITSQSIILVGKVLDTHDFAESRLYASDFTHGFRKASQEPQDAGAQ